MQSACRNWIVVVAATACLSNAMAQGEESDAFSLHGFGTLGIARSSSGEAEFVRDLAQTRGIGEDWSGRIDSILGLQASWRFAPDWEATGQVVSRLHYDHSHNPELMLGFVKWEPDAETTVRVGRVGADFMMRADSRLVGYSFLPVRPSVDFFGPLFFSHLDGGDLVLTYPVGAGILRGKVFYGATHEKAAGSPGIWDTRGSPVKGWVIDYLIGHWQLRANMAQINYASQIKTFGLRESIALGGLSTQAVAELTTKDKAARFFSVGAVYENGPLTLQGMVNKIQQESAVFQDSRAGYFLASYRLGTLTPFAGVSRWASSRQTYARLPLPALDAAYQQFMNASHADQTTYTLGLRWDAWSNVAFKVQLDDVRGKPDTTFPYASHTADWNGRTQVLSLAMDFVF